MNLDLLKKLTRLANNNPNENEANLAARRVCKMLQEGDWKLDIQSQQQQQQQKSKQDNTQSSSSITYEDIMEMIRNINEQKAREDERKFREEWERSRKRRSHNPNWNPFKEGKWDW